MKHSLKDNIEMSWNAESVLAKYTGENEVDKNQDSNKKLSRYNNISSKQDLND